MARPQFVEDIELDNIEFGHVDVGQISTDPILLKGYTAFLEAIQKAPNAVVIVTYGTTAKFHRDPNLSEQLDQLKSAQRAWDERKKYYEVLAEVGSLEYTYQESQAKDYADSEGLPWPPEHEPIAPFDAVIRDIDAAVAP